MYTHMRKKGAGCFTARFPARLVAIAIISGQRGTASWMHRGPCRTGGATEKLLMKDFGVERGALGGQLGKRIGAAHPSNHRVGCQSTLVAEVSSAEEIFGSRRGAGGGKSHKSISQSSVSLSL